MLLYPNCRWGHQGSERLRNLLDCRGYFGGSPSLEDGGAHLYDLQLSGCRSVFRVTLACGIYNGQGPAWPSNLILTCRGNWWAKRSQDLTKVGIGVQVFWLLFVLSNIANRLTFLTLSVMVSGIRRPAKLQIDCRNYVPLHHWNCGFWSKVLAFKPSSATYQLALGLGASCLNSLCLSFSFNRCTHLIGLLWGLSKIHPVKPKNSAWPRADPQSASAMAVTGWALVTCQHWGYNCEQESWFLPLGNLQSSGRHRIKNNEAYGLLANSSSTCYL